MDVLIGEVATRRTSTVLIPILEIEILTSPFFWTIPIVLMIPSLYIDQNIPIPLWEIDKVWFIFYIDGRRIPYSTDDQITMCRKVQSMVYAW